MDLTSLGQPQTLLDRCVFYPASGTSYTSTVSTSILHLETGSVGRLCDERDTPVLGVGIGVLVCLLMLML